jgi:hypothetical protein
MNSVEIGALLLISCLRTACVYYIEEAERTVSPKLSSADPDPTLEFCRLLVSFWRPRIR